MLGRGIDQIMPHPSDPTLYEAYVTSALGYVRLAERANGPIPRKCAYDYVWGDALADLEAARPQRASSTLRRASRRACARAEGHQLQDAPGERACLKAAMVDCCVLANNHVLDWGRGACSKPWRSCSEKTSSSPARGSISGRSRKARGDRFARGCDGFSFSASGQSRAGIPEIGRRGKTRGRRELATRPLASNRKRACRAHSRALRTPAISSSSPSIGDRIGATTSPRRSACFRSCSRRCRRLRSSPRPFLSPSARPRGLPGAADPLWLRRFHYRLRGHLRL